MPLWIGLFRGINVGGNNKLPMKELVKVLEAAGLIDVTTYIASGNMLFRSDRPEDELQTLIRDQVETHFGFRPLVFLITRDHLTKVANANPYKDHEHQGKAQHIFFLKAPATLVNHEFLDSLKIESEAYTVTDEALYLYAPEGIGRSQLVEKLGRGIKADMTARNLNTVITLLDMAAKLEADTHSA
jgi:uncharacterized protein (DUF1697 family)